VSPYVAGAALADHCAEPPAAAVVVLVAAVFLAAMAALILADAFIFHLDPQSGIVLIFLLVWQLLALLIFAAVALALRRRGTRGP
jgi:hypothetical protein